jgi:hypothetical protein
MPSKMPSKPVEVNAPQQTSAHKKTAGLIGRAAVFWTSWNYLKHILGGIGGFEQSFETRMDKGFHFF